MSRASDHITDLEALDLVLQAALDHIYQRYPGSTDFGYCRCCNQHIRNPHNTNCKYYGMRERVELLSLDF